MWIIYQKQCTNMNIKNYMFYYIWAICVNLKIFINQKQLYLNQGKGHASPGHEPSFCRPGMILLRIQLSLFYKKKADRHISF